jgi:hypothetical protein
MVAGETSDVAGRVYFQEAGRTLAPRWRPAHRECRDGNGIWWPVEAVPLYVGILLKSRIHYSRLTAC